MDEIFEDDEDYSVLDKSCIGCGECMMTCPSEAIEMNLRA